MGFSCTLGFEIVRTTEKVVHKVLGAYQDVLVTLSEPRSSPLSSGTYRGGNSTLGGVDGVLGPLWSKHIGVSRVNTVELGLGSPAADSY